MIGPVGFLESLILNNDKIFYDNDKIFYIIKVDMNFMRENKIKF